MANGRTCAVLLSCVLCAYVSTADESFFGVDSAAAWLARPGLFKTPTGETNLYAYTIGRIAETGFPQARERLSWREVNPKPDVWDCSRYLRVYSLYREKGIRVSGMFHDAPEWTEPEGKLPTDLKAVYDFAKRAAETFGDLVDDWEFWNEEDIGFCEASAWNYVAAAKAAYLGFKDARPDHLALMGALCKPSRSAYDSALFANDLGLYTDAMNFHVYVPRTDYPAVFGELKQFLSDRGLADLAIWVTESGTHEEGLCAKDGVMPGLRAHSPEQELKQAEYAAESQMLMMMAGVSRDYFFCFPPYNEMGGKKDWGAMRRDGSLKPVVTMFAEMIRRLGRAEPVGEVEAEDGRRAYAFRQSDGTYTVCTVGKGLPTYRDRVTDVRILKPVAPRGRLGAKPAEPDEDRRLVLQLKTDGRDFRLGGGKSSVELTGESGRLTVVVYNFEGKEKTGAVKVEGARIDGLPTSVTVPAWGKVELAGRYRPTDGASVERLVLKGLFDGRTSSRLVANITNPAAMVRSCAVLPLDAWDDARWERNDSADAYESTWDQEAGARRFHVTWRKNVDRWVYPRYRLKPGELEGALMLEFEIKSAQDKVENDFRTQNAMLFSKSGTRHIGFPASLGTWERRTIDLSNEKGFGNVQTLSIGLNPCGQDLTYWIRNVRLYKARPTGFYSVAERDGRWVAQDPNGKPFTFLGVDHVRPDGHMCEALGYAPYGRFVETNYPSREAWATETVSRLKSWGFNALGSGCEFKELKGKGLVRTVFLSMGESVCYGDKSLWISKCLHSPGTAFPNVFHPGFAESCERIAAKKCAATRNDRSVFGYFIDNELAWRGDGMFDAVMNRPDDDCAKKALVAWLRGRPVTSELKQEFLGLCAERYFAITTSAIRRYDPNHLVLGCRFAGIGQKEPVWKAAARHCDVLTFNHYPWADLDRNVVLTKKGGVRVKEVYDALYEKAQRPLLITEWSFPATDTDAPSRYGAGQRFETQALRVQAAELFAKTLLSLPYFIGYDYFMWVDEPPLGIGRHFPEDSNYGLVNNAGKPYEKLTRMFSALHRDVDKWRRAPLPVEREAPSDVKTVFERNRFFDSVKGGPEAVRFDRTAAGWRLSNDCGLVLSGGNGRDMVAEVAVNGWGFGTCGALLDAIGASGHRWMDARGGQTVAFSRKGTCGVVTVRAEGGDETGRFALTCRFVVAPGKRDFLCEIVSVENLGTTPWNVQGLYFRPFPYGQPKEAVPSVPFLWKGRLESGWKYEDGATYTLVSGDPDVVEFRAWIDGQGVLHPDMRFVPPEPLVLKPGETYRPPRPFSALACPGA